MFNSLENITIHWEEDGKLKIKELEKCILSRGSWTTIMFLYQELNIESNTYGEPKITIRRYKKRDGIYILQSKFNISSKNQAAEIVKSIQQWLLA